jgi:hypothetical protein
MHSFLSPLKINEAHLLRTWQVRRVTIIIYSTVIFSLIFIHSHNIAFILGDDCSPHLSEKCKHIFPDIHQVLRPVDHNPGSEKAPVNSFSVGLLALNLSSNLLIVNVEGTSWWDPEKCRSLQWES